jgi:hypothetical protein
MPDAAKSWLAAKRASLFVLLILGICTTCTRAQCVDSSEVNGFKVRSVKLKSLFGRTPKELQEILDKHRGESYSADAALAAIREIRSFYATDPAQEKYERLIANKLKLSVKAGTTWLECVKKVEVTECQHAFPATTQCVDFTLKRYFIDVDAVDSSPYFLLFPRSALAAYYRAIPRGLMAVNPALDADQDKRFGPAASIDTATDLLDLRSIFGSMGPAPAGPSESQPSRTPNPDAPDAGASFVFGGTGNTAGAAGAGDGEPPLALPEKDTKLLLKVKAVKSLTRDYYKTSSHLTLSQTHSLNLFQNLALEAAFDASHMPQGSGDLFTNAGSVGFSTDLRPRHSPIQLIKVGGRYQFSRNQFFNGPTGTPERTSESTFRGRTLIDGNFGGALARAALWFDAGAVDPGRNYRRLSTLVGYGKEIARSRKKDFHLISPPELDDSCWTSIPDPSTPDEVIKNEQTFNFELLAGAGRIWGDVPTYETYYAGNPSGQFLYDDLSDEKMSAAPFGPFIRTLPRAEGGVMRRSTVVGGESYWHANVSLSIPISAWSRPLIPHEWVTKSTARPGNKQDAEFLKYFQAHGISADAKICRDLKSTIKTLVAVSGVNLLVNQQARDQLTEAEKKDLRLRNKEGRTEEEDRRLQAAEKKLADAKVALRPQVEQLFEKEIIPITDFVSDHANIIAVKPLLMFDVAHLGGARGLGKVDRFGVGGGLQLDVVLARFELGYLASVKRANGDPRGNFFGRLVLKRFF